MQPLLLQGVTPHELEVPPGGLYPEVLPEVTQEEHLVLEEHQGAEELLLHTLPTLLRRWPNRDLFLYLISKNLISSDRKPFIFPNNFCMICTLWTL